MKKLDRQPGGTLAYRQHPGKGVTKLSGGNPSCRAPLAAPIPSTQFKAHPRDANLPAVGASGKDGLSGSKMPFCTSSSRLARTEIFLSKAENF